MSLQFLLYNHVLTQEEIEAHAEDGVPECPPTLEQFKEQVRDRTNVYDALVHQHRTKYQLFTAQKTVPILSHRIIFHKANRN